jgi:hypothetical protein
MAISLIAGIAMGVGVGLTATVYAFSWMAFAIGAGFSMLSKALMPKPDLTGQMSGRSVMTRDSAHSRKIVYGRAKIGGNVVYLESTGTDNKHLWLVIAVAGHEIDAYESVWFNDEKVWDGGVYQSGWASSGSTSTSPYVYIGFHNGDQTSVDSALNAASTKWTADHKLLDTAYMVVKLTYDQDKFAKGLPNISAIIRGKKVLHTAEVTAGNFYVGEKYKITQVGTTNFIPIGASSNTVGVVFTATNVGSGTGKANIIDWSQNPALCIRDYLTDTKYGLGESSSNILSSSVNTAFGVCNETVALAAGGTQARYTLDGVIDTAGSLKSNIELMVGAMAGRLVYSAGKFEIHAGSYVAPTFTVDESQIIGDITVQTKQSKRDGYNAVKGVFLSEDDNYVLADYPAQVSKTVAGSFVVDKRYKILIIGSTDFTAIGASANTVGLDFTATGVGSGDGTASLFLAEDGEQSFLDLALPLVVNNIRAQRLARLALLRSRQQESITIPCNLSALRFQIGDNIEVTNTRLGYNEKVFEVVGYSIGFTPGGEIAVNVQAIETASSIWSWSTTDEEVFLGGGEVALYDGSVAAAPTSINVTSDSFLSDDGTFNSQFNVAWTNADDAFTEHYVVEWKLASVSNYFSQTTKSTPFSIVNLVNNASYNVRVKAVNEIGVSSAYLSATPTSAIDATAPSLPSSITATAGYKSISLAWTYPSQKDFNNIEIWRSATPTGTYLEVSNVAGGFGAKAEHLDGGLGDATAYSYKFKSVDLTGNKTSTPDFNNQTPVTQTTNAASVDGVNTAPVYAYKRSSSTLGSTDKPTTTRTWTFANGSFDNNDLGNSWTGEVPSGTDDLYICVAVASSTGATDLIVAADWSAPQVLGAKGDTGGNGVNTAVVYGYKRSTSTVTDKPSTTRTWTFSTGTFDNNDLGNSFTGAIPSGTDELYVCIAVASSVNSTDSVAGTSDWSAPQLLAAEGTDGYNTAVVYGYKRSSSTVTDKPSTTRTWTFSTASFNNNDLGNSFTAEIPSGTDDLYACTAVARSQSSTDSVAGTSDWSAPQLLAASGDTGAAGVRNASGYVYYSQTSANAPSAPTASAYNFSTGAFTSLTSNWSRTPPVNTGGDAKYWATSYYVTEATYNGTQTLTFGAVFNSVTFNGLVTFQNLNTALATDGGNVTTIDGGLITTNSIIVSKLSGDVTEVYPIGQYYYTALTSSAATMGSFTLPAPELGILKRQRIDVNVLFYIVNANQTAAAQSSIIFTVQKKSKGVNAVTVGTVTSESTAIAYNQVVSIPGNQLDKVDVSGGVAASANASGSNEPAYIQAVYYDVTANKTYIQCSAYTTLFSNGNTLYFSDSKFTSAGTWVTPSTTETIFIPTPPDVGAGSGYASVYLPFKMSYGQTTTATDYRVRSHVSSAQSGVTYTAQRMVGTLENIS